MSLVKRDAPAALVRTEDYALAATTDHERTYMAMYETLFPRLCDFAERFLSQGDAPDAVHDAMADIWEHWPVLSLDPPPFTYYFRAVRNQIANRRRGEYRDSRRLGRYLYRLARRSTRASRPDVQLERAELAALIEATVGSLPARCREVWTLVREQDMTYEAAAGVMEVQPVSAKKYMTRAQSVLRETLNDAGYNEAALAAKKLPPGKPAEGDDD